ncbi:MAG: type III-A CRISPR-associated protein Csm2 [Saprospiraceae bacterium]|nr:type III-A CRISPR-associated protein Csm2 [Saprospiraceae bacterium]
MNTATRSNWDYLREFSSDWISKPEMTPDEGKKYLRFVEEFGLFLCAKTPDGRVGFNAMTTAQIRNVFGEMKRIASNLDFKEPKTSESVTDEQKQQIEVANEKWKSVYSAFLMLRPKVAYNTARAQARTRDTRMINFKELFEKAHEAVNSPYDFGRFVTFFEGVLAYHKVHGGRD